MLRRNPTGPYGKMQLLTSFFIVNGNKKGCKNSRNCPELDNKLTQRCGWMWPFFCKDKKIQKRKSPEIFKKFFRSHPVPKGPTMCILDGVSEKSQEPRGKGTEYSGGSGEE